MQNTKESQNTDTWVDLPPDHTKPNIVLQYLLKQLTVATQYRDGQRCARMLLYLIKVTGLANIPDQGIENVSQRLTYKVTKCHLSKATIANAYCRVGVLSKDQWGTMEQAQHGDLQSGDMFHLGVQPENRMIDLIPNEELQQKELVIEVWSDERKDGCKVSLPTPGTNDKKCFVGRTHCTLQDLTLIGTSEKELTLYSHSKKNERGSICVQLGLRGPQFDTSEVMHSHEVLFKAIVKHESQKEGSGWTRNWSAELPPLARDLLLTHAKWYGIGTPQRVAMELRLLMDYHQRYGVNVKAYSSLLDEVGKEGAMDMSPSNGIFITNQEETKSNSPPNATSPPPRSGPTSPSFPRSEVTSPFSGEPLPLEGKVLKRQQTSKNESEATPKPSTESEATPTESEAKAATGCDSEATSKAAEHDSDTSSNLPSPQATKQEWEWPEEWKLTLKDLSDYVEEKLSKHFLFFDITKLEEKSLKEYLKVLSKLYTLHPFVAQLPGDRNFKTTLEICIKDGIQHWISVCNVEAQPISGGLQYNAKSLKAQAEACSAKCKEVKEHIGDLFKQFGVDYYSIFIQMIGSEILKLSELFIPKEGEVLALDKDTTLLFYQAYLACRETEKCASVSLLEELKLWSCYKPLVGSWVETTCTICKERIKKAVEIDKFEKVIPEAKHSPSAVDSAGIILHVMVDFWKKLDWPNGEEAFGYGLKHFENLSQCVTYYVDTSYQDFYEKCLLNYQGKFSVSEKVCVFLSNLTYMRNEATLLAQRLEIKPIGQDETFDKLKASTDQSIEQKIQSCMEQICGRLKFERLSSPEEQWIESIKEFLATNLTVFKDNLPGDIYRHKILCIMWTITLRAVNEQLDDNKSERRRQTLHSALVSLKDFFSEALTMEELETFYYKDVEVKCLPAKDLIVKCCLELVEQQPAITLPSPIGKLSFSVAYLEDKSVLEVNVLNAKLVTGDKNKKDGSADTFVQVWLLPQVMFPECTKGSYKTDLKKGALNPVYYKELQLTARLEDLRRDGAILVLAVYFTDMKHIAGLCVAPCKDVPVLQNDSGRQKFTLPLFLAKMHNSRPLMELKDRWYSRDEETADFYYVLEKVHADSYVSTLEVVPPPPPPIGLKADEIKTTSIALSWKSPHDINGIIRGYQVSYTPHGESECLHDVGDTTSTELTSLKPHTKYVIRVRVEMGDFSTPITVSTLEEGLLQKKISSILDNYKDITFKQLRIIKLIFYGTPRAGKTTLRKQLLTSVEDNSLQPSSATLQPSTKVAEICDPVFVERIAITNEENYEWRWTVQKLDDIAKTLLQCLDNQLLHCEKEVVSVREELNVTAAQSPTPVPLYVHNEQMASTPSLYVPPSQSLTEGEQDHVPKTTSPSLEQDEISTSSTVPDMKQLFSEAVKTGQWSEVVSALNIDRAMLMQVIDGGGQPSFQEIFPLLISGPSLTLLMFKLTDDFQKTHDVQYQPIDGVEHTWKDTYVVRDFIFHAISSMVSFTDDINNPKILLVGTHKDKIKGSEGQKEAEIMKIAKSMHGWLRELKAFKSIHVKKVEDLVTGIDNFKQQDIQKVKNKIEELVSQTPSKDIPAPWLVFDFVLHAYAKSKQLRKVEKIKCEQIAKNCGVKDEEFEVVLQYLHYEAGTLLYYPDIPELRNCVITDFQLIFDSISKIIIDYFDDSSDHGPHLQDKHLLREKGQLEASVLKDVEGCLKVNELLSLMQHRHIISKMDGDMFFMPSVLPKAEPSYKISRDSCSFLVMFEHGCCPIGLFCAVTTNLIVTHRWRVKKDEPQYRDKISLYYSCSGKSYHIIFSAFCAHYEICLIDIKAKPNIKYAIYKVIDEVFTTVCKDMNYPTPSYGFYCPKKCTYGGVTHSRNKHPAYCAFNMQAQEMTCYYSDSPSGLTEEHKSWFQEVQPQEWINVPPPPPIGLKADRIKTTSMTISWQPPHNPNGIIRGYQVSYTPYGESECLHDVGDTTSTELTSLKPHTEYTIRVRAKTVDIGDYSTPITVITLEDVSISVVPSASGQLLSEQIHAVAQAMSLLEGTPTMPELLSYSAEKLNVAIRVGAKYSTFGIFLLEDKTGTILEALEVEHRGNAERINMAILQRWLQGKGMKSVTWSALIEVLRKIGI